MLFKSGVRLSEIFRKLCCIKLKRPFMDGDDKCGEDDNVSNVIMWLVCKCH